MTTEQRTDVDPAAGEVLFAPAKLTLSLRILGVRFRFGLRIQNKTVCAVIMM